MGITDDTGAENQLSYTIRLYGRPVAYTYLYSGVKFKTLINTPTPLQCNPGIIRTFTYLASTCEALLHLF